MDPEGVNSCIESRVAPCFLSDLTQCPSAKNKIEEMYRDQTTEKPQRKKEPGTCNPATMQTTR